MGSRTGEDTRDTRARTGACRACRGGWCCCLQVQMVRRETPAEDEMDHTDVYYWSEVGTQAAPDEAARVGTPAVPDMLLTLPTG